MDAIYAVVVFVCVAIMYWIPIKLLMGISYSPSQIKGELELMRRERKG